VGLASPAEEEVASPFPPVFGSQHSRSSDRLVYLWNHIGKAAAAKVGAEAEGKWQQACVRTRAQMTRAHTRTVPTNILNSSLGEEMLSACMPLV